MISNNGTRTPAATFSAPVDFWTAVMLGRVAFTVADSSPNPAEVHPLTYTKKKKS